MTQAPIVCVLDYGVGNLQSVQQAFEVCGANVITIDNLHILDKENCLGLVLPGVGAFAEAMGVLERKNLIKPLQDYMGANRPFLGICLGMQMMLEASEEFGFHQGLGLVGGTVKKIPETASTGLPHRIPHIGWNVLLKHTADGNQAWSGTILEDLEEGLDSVYFVHSYAAYPNDENMILADTVYNGRRFCAAIRHGNLYGCQFHPEKSGKTGLKILSRFLESISTN